MWAGVLLGGCGGATGERQGSAGPAATNPEPAAAGSGAASVAADPTSVVASPAPAPSEPASLFGWWRGDEVCVELFTNGDFELSLMRREPKVMAMGAATIVAAGDGFELKLATERIWRARFTGPCRKVHEYGGWTDSQEFLEVPFKPGEASTLKIRHAGDAQVELCGRRCVTLTRGTQHLGARWRRAGLPYPDRPEQPWQEGDLLELKLDDDLAHLWAGLGDGKHATVYGKSKVQYTAPDRFTVTFTAEWFADKPPGVTAKALGLAFDAGDARTFEVRRLAGERLEVCAAADRCTTLERQFDGSDHDIG